MSKTTPTLPTLINSTIFTITQLLKTSFSSEDKTNILSSLNESIKLLGKLLVITRYIIRNPLLHDIDMFNSQCQLSLISLHQTVHQLITNSKDIISTRKQFFEIETAITTLLDTTYSLPDVPVVEFDYHGIVEQMERKIWKFYYQYAKYIECKEMNVFQGMFYLQHNDVFQIWLTIDNVDCIFDDSEIKWNIVKINFFKPGEQTINERMINQLNKFMQLNYQYKKYPVKALIDYLNKLVKFYHFSEMTQLLKSNSLKTYYPYLKSDISDKLNETHVKYSHLKKDNHNINNSNGNHHNHNHPNHNNSHGAHQNNTNNPINSNSPNNTNNQNVHNNQSSSNTSNNQNSQNNQPTGTIQKEKLKVLNIYFWKSQKYYFKYTYNETTCELVGINSPSNKSISQLAVNESLESQLNKFTKEYAILRTKELQEVVTKIEDRAEKIITDISVSQYTGMISFKCPYLPPQSIEFYCQLLNEIERDKDKELEDLIHDICIHAYYYQLYNIAQIIFNDKKMGYIDTDCMTVIKENIKKNDHIKGEILTPRICNSQLFKDLMKESAKELQKEMQKDLHISLHKDHKEKNEKEKCSSLDRIDSINDKRLFGCPFRIQISNNYSLCFIIIKPEQNLICFGFNESMVNYCSKSKVVFNHHSNTKPCIEKINSFYQQTSTEFSKRIYTNLFDEHMKKLKEPQSLVPVKKQNHLIMCKNLPFIISISQKNEDNHFIVELELSSLNQNIMKKFEKNNQHINFNLYLNQYNTQGMISYAHNQQLQQLQNIHGMHNTLNVMNTNNNQHQQHIMYQPSHSPAVLNQTNQPIQQNNLNATMNTNSNNSNNHLNTSANLNNLNHQNHIHNEQKRNCSIKIEDKKIIFLTTKSQVEEDVLINMKRMIRFIHVILFVNKLVDKVIKFTENEIFFDGFSIEFHSEAIDPIQFVVKVEDKSLFNNHFIEFDFLTSTETNYHHLKTLSLKESSSLLKNLYHFVQHSDQLIRLFSTINTTCAKVTITEFMSITVFVSLENEKVNDQNFNMFFCFTLKYDEKTVSYISRSLEQQVQPTTSKKKVINDGRTIMTNVQIPSTFKIEEIIKNMKLIVMNIHAIIMTEYVMKEVHKEPEGTDHFKCKIRQDLCMKLPMNFPTDRIILTTIEQHGHIDFLTKFFNFKFANPFISGNLNEAKPLISMMTKKTKLEKILVDLEPLFQVCSDSITTMFSFYKWVQQMNQQNQLNNQNNNNTATTNQNASQNIQTNLQNKQQNVNTQNSQNTQTNVQTQQNTQNPQQIIRPKYRYLYDVVIRENGTNKYFMDIYLYDNYYNFIKKKRAAELKTIYIHPQVHLITKTEDEHQKQTEKQVKYPSVKCFVEQMLARFEHKPKE